MMMMISIIQYVWPIGKLPSVKYTFLGAKMENMQAENAFVGLNLIVYRNIKQLPLANEIELWVFHFIVL